jgi:hypothetical protein
MATKEERLARAHNRKPQINFELTKEEKQYFENIAKARKMKLAALIRDLLRAEGDRLGVPDTSSREVRILPLPREIFK